MNFLLATFVGKKPYHCPSHCRKKKPLTVNMQNLHKNCDLRERKWEFSGALDLLEILVFITHKTHPTLWTSEHSMQEIILISCFTNCPFYFWPSWKSNAQSQKYWKPKTGDSHSVSPYDASSGKYAHQWATYWTSFDRTALTNDKVPRILWHYYRTVSSKKTGLKTLQLGTICVKQRHMYGLCSKTSNPADLRMRPFLSVTPFTKQQVVSASVGINCLRKARPSETGCGGFKLLQTVCIEMYPPRI